MDKPFIDIKEDLDEFGFSWHAKAVRGSLFGMNTGTDIGSS